MEAAVDEGVVETGPVGHRPVIEVGWLLVGSFDKQLDKAARRGRAVFARAMREHFPEFDWRVSLVIVPAARQAKDSLTAAVEPVALLDIALQEREARRWDFALALYAGELVGYERSVPLGAPSAAIACAAVGMARLWEPCDDPADKACQRRSVELASERAARLAAHLLGHLVGLGHSAAPGDYMYPPHGVGDLDHMAGFADETAAELRAELADVADPRLEEEGAEPAVYGPVPRDAKALARFAGRLGALRFALLAAWQHQDDVWRIIARIRPWVIPLRLGRLITAAASTLVILMMTAEAWEAGMSQPIWRVILLSLLSLSVASTYLIHKQRLLIGRPRGPRGGDRARRPSRHSEQRSVGNVAVVLAVVAGMATTYAALFTVSLIAAYACYPEPLVRNWAGSVENPMTLARYLCLSGSVASLGLAIGALGASFEPRGYVRHVAYVDEEV